MLIFDKREIGNRLLYLRKRLGLTQAEIAEAAELSDRAYADIERGANMRADTLLRICRALGVTPDDILTRQEDSGDFDENEVLDRLAHCQPEERRTALRLVQVYLHSRNS